MWGETWGTMIWGGGVHVPTVGPLGLLLLGVLLGVTGVLYWKPLSKAGIAVALLAIGTVPLHALAVTHFFANGTVADADEVNANFAEIEGSLPSLALSNEFKAIKDNQSSGSTGLDLGPSTNRACFLTGTLHQGDNNNVRDTFSCKVREGAGSWALFAGSLSTGNYVECSARCLTW